ncbi:MAG: FliO/MopB family protein [Thermodesulfobacteriota bacterium]
MRTNLVLFFTLLPTVAFTAPGDGDDMAFIPMTLNMLAALGVVIGLFLLLYALVRKSRSWLAGGSMQDSIDIRAVRHLGPKRALYLVDVDGRRFFIAAAGENIRLLAEWEGQEGLATHKTDPDHDPSAASPSFAALMQRQSKKNGRHTSSTDADAAAKRAASKVHAGEGAHKGDSSCPDV